MFTIYEKSTLITALLTRRNVIETGNPYISANDSIKKKEQGIILKTKAEPRGLSKRNTEEITKINSLIDKLCFLQ